MASPNNLASGNEEMSLNNIGCQMTQHHKMMLHQQMKFIIANFKITNCVEIDLVITKFAITNFILTNLEITNFVFRN
jgi:hypothetical protein